MARNKGFRFKKAFEAAGGITAQLASPIGNIAKQEFEENFDRQGFMDNRLERWKEVQRRIPGTQSYKRATPSGRSAPILRGRGSGVLAKSIRVVRATSRLIRLSTIGKANNYAAYHNDGSGKIPKRQFMGNSKNLDRLIIKRIDREIMKALRMV